MQYNFELYVLTETLTPEIWTKFYESVQRHSGLMSKLELSVHLKDNVIRFFVRSNKDLGALSNGIDGVLLRPVDDADITIPTHSSKERFVQFVTGGNLLDLKERYSVKKTRELEYAVFSLRGLNARRTFGQVSLYFKHPGGHYSKAAKLLHFFPAQLFSVDFASNARYLKKTVPRYLNIEKALHMLASDEQDALFKVSTFPYFTHDYYLKLTDYEFDKHSFIIGASGSGKSKLIGLFVDRLYRTALKMNYRVIVIDPHASIAEDFAHIQDSKVINFNSESAQLFGGAATDLSAATELTATLFKSLMNETYNSKVDRVLRFTLFVLFTAQNMSLDTLKRFLTDLDLRNQILEHVKGYVPNNIVHFFGADFNEMRTKYYNEAIAPVVALVDELQLQPLLVGEGELSLAKTIQDHFLTVFSLNKVSMGERVVKTVAGLLIQQIFLLAQARAFGQKVILVIDEVSVVQNPALASILAEARKFNLSVILTQQYFGQIHKDLRDAIFANVYNYYTFKVSEEDARALEGNLNIELPKELVEEEHKKGINEQDIRVKIMTELHPRECLVRVLSNGQVAPAIKARTVNAPLGSEATMDPEKLRAYKQATTPSLPTKFQEAPAKPVQQAEPTPSAPASPFAAPDTQPAAPSAGLFNLSELLASHSSSRLKVNKKKDDA